jgi:hypothetical protein
VIQEVVDMDVAIGVIAGILGVSDELAKLSRAA